MGWNVLLGLSLATTPAAHAGVRDTLPVPAPSRDLPPISIRGRSHMGIRRGDTIVIAANRYTSLATQRVDDLFRNLPGFQVDAQGKITYAGKEVSRLFIDGEDLGGEQYPLVARLLSASLIDSIQVIDRFHPNRMLRAIDPEKGMAINLITAQQYRKRLQPSLAASFRTAALWSGNARVLQLRPKQKLILHAGRDGESTALLNPSGKQHPFLLQRRLSDPENFDDRSWNGRTSSAFNVLSGYSLNRYTRARLMLSRETMSWSGMNKEQLQYSDGTVLAREWQSHEFRSVFRVETQIDRDAGKSHTGNYRLRVERIQQSVTDKESKLFNSTNLPALTTDAIIMRFEIHQGETWKLKQNAVLQWSNSFTDDRLADNRSFVHHRRDLHHAISYWRKREQSSYKIGMHRLRSHLTSCIPGDSLRVLLIKQYLHAQAQHSISRRWSADATGMAGWAHEQQVNHRQRFIYHAAVGTSVQVSRLQQLTMHVQVVRTSDDLHQLHAGLLHRSPWEWRRGNRVLAFPQTRSGVVSYTRMDVYRSILMGVQLSYSAIQGEGMSSVVIDRSSVELAYFIAPMHLDRRAMIFFESLIFPIRIRYRTQVSYASMDLPQQVNDRLNRFRFTQYDGLMECRTQWKSRWSFEARHRMQWSKQAIGYSTHFTVRYALERKLQGQVDHQWIGSRGTSMESPSSFHFLQARCIWIMHAKWRTEFLVMNALDQRAINWMEVNAQVTRVQQMPVAPRSFAIRLSIDL